MFLFAAYLLLLSCPPFSTSSVATPPLASRPYLPSFHRSLLSFLIYARCVGSAGSLSRRPAEWILEAIGKQKNWVMRPRRVFFLVSYLFTLGYRNKRSLQESSRYLTDRYARSHPSLALCRDYAELSSCTPTCRNLGYSCLCRYWFFHFALAAEMTREWNQALICLSVCVPSFISSSSSSSTFDLCIVSLPYVVVGRCTTTSL